MSAQPRLLQIAGAVPDHLRLERSPMGLEHLMQYEPSGHHPVHLHDTLGPGGRYRVIHKLGRGGFANIWLCQDMEALGSPKYVALKVVVASVPYEDCFEIQLGPLQHIEDDGRICLALDYFQIHGPNGAHPCFVYPLLGPKVSLGLHGVTTNPDRVLREICFDVVKTVGILHRHNICHGDLSTNNILHRVQGFDGLAEDEVLQVLGKPEKNYVFQGAAKGHDKPTVPQYLLYSVDWEKVPRRFIAKALCIINFGQSFYTTKPRKNLGLAGPYRSPELLLENSVTIGVDLWALGCSLFEIRTGRKLFNCFDDEDDDYLDAMVQILGQMPEPWWSTTWKERETFYEDHVDSAGRPISAGDEDDEDESDVHGGRATIRLHPSIAYGARSLRDKLRPGLWYLDSDQSHRDISDDEINTFSDLLEKFLQWDPKARLSSEAAWQHA